MNRCIFTGRTTDEAELRYANNAEHTPVANVSIAVDDGYGDNKRTSFFKLTLFDKRAESFAKLVPKGTKVAVEARAQQNKWKAQDGTNRYEIVFVVSAWEFAQSKGDATSIGPTGPKEDAEGWMQVEGAIEEELPFS